MAAQRCHFCCAYIGGRCKIGQIMFHCNIVWDDFLHIDMAVVPPTPPVAGYHKVRHLRRRASLRLLAVLLPAACAARRFRNDPLSKSFKLEPA
jgi:hypothetical protein